MSDHGFELYIALLSGMSALVIIIYVNCNIPIIQKISEEL